MESTIEHNEIMKLNNISKLANKLTNKIQVQVKRKPKR